MDRWQQARKVRSRGNTDGGGIPRVEEAGVALAWEECDVVALDSQGVIRRVINLQHQAPWSWIEAKLKAQIAERPRALMWVRGH